MVNRWGNSENSDWLYFSGLQNHRRWCLQPWNEKTLAPWKEIYDQPRQRVKKQRHHFVNKGPSIKAMVYPVVMYGCESCTIKKAERWRIDVSELWCWRKLSFFLSFFLLLYSIVVVFAIHQYESAMDLHVFPILNPPSISLPIPPFWLILVPQPWALVSRIKPGLAQ